jgi:hypothetical protein
MVSKTAGKIAVLPARYLTVLGLAAALGFGALPVMAQQTQSDSPQSTAPGPDAQGQGQQPNSPEQAPPMAQPPRGQPDQQAQSQPNQPVPPATLTIPAGTIVRVRVDEWISSDRNVIGDNFSAVLDQPIVVDGWVVARKGQAQTGRVSTVKKGRAGGASQLGVEIPELTLVDGQQLPAQTQLFQASSGPDRGRQVGTVGATTGFGALIGAIAGGGTGAAIGAGLGATAGVAGVMYTKGNPTEIPPETVLSFRLQAPVTISTEKSQFAFQPVGQSDYNNSRSLQRRPRISRPVPPPPPLYPYPYPYAFGYPYPYPWYPEPFVGFGFGYYGRYQR